MAASAAPGSRQVLIEGEAADLQGTLAWPANGTYELSARLTSLTPQPVEVFWCAAGLPTGTARGHACTL